MKAAIIAGGFGKRLKPLTQERPKPLVPVARKAIIEWQIEWLKKYGVDTVVVLAGYQREKMIEFLGSGTKYGVKIVYTIEDEPLGTAGAIKNAEPILRTEPFLALNGDVITNIPLDKLMKVIEGKDAVVAMALVPLRSPYGIVEVDESGKIVRFVEKPILHQHLINAGVYYMRPEIFDYLPERGDIERTTFPQLAREGKLYAGIFRDVYWRSIDTMKDVEEASKELANGLPGV